VVGQLVGKVDSDKNHNHRNDPMRSRRIRDAQLRLEGRQKQLLGAN